MQNKNVKKERVENKENFVNLQKNIKNAEADRKAFAEETVALVSKQKTNIKFLKQENKALKDRLTIIFEKNFIKNDFIANKKDLEKKITIKKYKKDLNSETEKLKKLENDIRTFKKQIINRKKMRGGINGLENENQLTKQIKILENRLDKTNQKFNNVVTKNSNLRKEIDSLEKERDIFEQLYNKLEKRLENKKKGIAELMLRAKDGYLERDRFNNQIEKLKQISQKKAKIFEEELKELAIISEKNLENIEYVSKFNLDSKQPDDIENDNNFLKKQNNLICKEEIEKLMKKHQRLKMDLMKLQVTTNIFDLPDLIKKFKFIEENNFKRFNYINELSNQIENLDININKLKQEKDDLLNMEKKSNLDRKIFIDKKIDIIEINNKKSDSFILKTSSIQNLLKEANKEIETIFYYLECDHLLKKNNRDNFLEIKNILLTLGLIEKKQLEILHAYSIILKKRKLENFKLQNFNEISKQEIEDKKMKDYLLLEKEEEDFQPNSNTLLSYNDFRMLGIDKVENLKSLEYRNKGKINKLNGN